MHEIASVDDIVAVLDETVAGVDEFKRRLALVVHRQLVAGGAQGVPHPPNVVVIGPTGGGKTHTLDALLRALPTPWVQGSLTAYTDTGYDGKHLDDLYGGLFDHRPAGDDGKPVRVDQHQATVERYGIVVLDEFDKLRTERGSDQRSNARNFGLQTELLTLVEGTRIKTRGVMLDTRGILHIAVGAFQGIDRVVAANDPDVHPDQPDLYLMTEAEDIAGYGFLEELAGRFSTVLALPPLNVDHMLRVLVDHVLPGYHRQFEAMGMHLEVDDSGARSVAALATHDRFGARSLVPLLESYLNRSWAAAHPGDTVVLDAHAVEHKHARLVTA